MAELIDDPEWKLRSQGHRLEVINHLLSSHDQQMQQIYDQMMKKSNINEIRQQIVQVVKQTDLKNRLQSMCQDDISRLETKRYRTLHDIIHKCSVKIQITPEDTVDTILSRIVKLHREGTQVKNIDRIDRYRREFDRRMHSIDPELSELRVQLRLISQQILDLQLKYMELQAREAKIIQEIAEEQHRHVTPEISRLLEERKHLWNLE
jgi:hypothetical protein